MADIKVPLDTDNPEALRTFLIRLVSQLSESDDSAYAKVDSENRFSKQQNLTKGTKIGNFELVYNESTESLDFNWIGN